MDKIVFPLFLLAKQSTHILRLQISLDSPKQSLNDRIVPETHRVFLLNIIPTYTPYRLNRLLLRHVR